MVEKAQKRQPPYAAGADSWRSTPDAVVLSCKETINETEQANITNDHSDCPVNLPGSGVPGSSVCRTVPGRHPSILSRRRGSQTDITMLATERTVAVATLPDAASGTTGSNQPNTSGLRRRYFHALPRRAPWSPSHSVYEAEQGLSFPTLLGRDRQFTNWRPVRSDLYLNGMKDERGHAPGAFEGESIGNRPTARERQIRQRL